MGNFPYCVPVAAGIVDVFMGNPRCVDDPVMFLQAMRRITFYLISASLIYYAQNIPYADGAFTILSD